MPTKPFSGSLNLIDLNDYLGPSQVCIKPTTSKLQTINSNNSIKQSSTNIRLDESTNTYYESNDLNLKEEIKLKKAEITLNDCLACSGCITSSESILVSLQSADEVLKSISEGDRYPIVSISSHSLASLAAYHDIDSLLLTFNALKRYFSTRLGFRLVLDLGFAQRLNLWASRKEFLDRWKRPGPPSSQPVRRKPILASSCPGWICYAEKTQGKSGILEMISQVRSAQQIQGALVKSEQMAKTLGTTKERIYHVCVMSCYDKKLEASRSDFQVDGLKDVDCVLTTKEVQNMMEQDSFNLSEEASRLNSIWPTVQSSPSHSGIPIWIYRPEPRGSSSGGYLFNIMRSVARQISKEDQENLKIVVDSRRGTDYTEYSLILEPQSSDGSDTGTVNREVLFHGARFYGFKNLQNLINKIGTNKSNQRFPGRRRKELQQISSRSGDQGFDYVEVMACPSGCVNGGGQITAPTSKIRTEDVKGDEEVNPNVTITISAKEWIKKVEEKYKSSRRSEREGGEDESIPVYLNLDSGEEEEEIEIEEFLERWKLSDDYKVVQDEIFKTHYRAIEDEVNGFAVQW